MLHPNTILKYSFTHIRDDSTEQCLLLQTSPMDVAAPEIVPFLRCVRTLKTKASHGKAFIGWADAAFRVFGGWVTLWLLTSVRKCWRRLQFTFWHLSCLDRGIDEMRRWEFRYGRNKRICVHRDNGRTQVKFVLYHWVIRVLCLMLSCTALLHNYCPEIALTPRLRKV